MRGGTRQQPRGDAFGVGANDGASEEALASPPDAVNRFPTDRLADSPVDNSPVDNSPVGDSIDVRRRHNQLSPAWIRIWMPSSIAPSWTIKRWPCVALYRISGAGSESSFGRRWRAYGIDVEPHLMYVEGSPEQIALSLSRVEAGDTPEALDLALTENAEVENLGRGQPITTIYSRADDQDKLRRSTDLYIDLDAADSEPVVVDHVTKQSDEYRELFGVHRSQVVCRGRREC